jgi:PAS domain S-box-containing protein
MESGEVNYKNFIADSFEGIWRIELDKPIDIKRSPTQQIKDMYAHAYLAEANMSMAKMYGFRSPKQMVGLRLGDLLIQADPENEAYLRAFIAAGYKLSGVDSHEKDKHGNDHYFRNSLRGVVRDGKLLHAWGTQLDVTDQRLALDALQASEERLTLAMNVAQIGIWEWNVITRELTWPAELKKMFGFKPKDEITFEKYMERIHPDDREELQKTIEEGMKSGEPYQSEHRIIWPDGSVHWIQSHGQAFSKDGKPFRMLGTASNVDQSKRAEDALRESELRFMHMVEEQTQLVELNAAKDEFISLASHQLRTPATGVKQFIGMLLDEYFGKVTADQRSILEYAYESNERQLQVINDLLKVAQVDAGKLVLSKQETDIATLIEDVMQEQRAQFTSRKQRVVLDRPEKAVFASIDAARIRMVVENLIDNASKYTPDGKRITVTINHIASKKEVVIKIKDEGVGIAAEDLPKLFQKFSRLENPLSIQVGGTGIGLYWAKKIIDLHEGSIKIRSTLGKGTTFIVRIPT